MKFDLEHDWQGNMSTPRKNLGEKTKFNLFIALTVIWATFGLIGHDPWPPQESETISQIVSIIHDGEIIAPLSASNTYLTTPPLYALIASVFVKILTPLLAFHDAARLSNLLWLAITLVAVGMSARELLGRGFGRQAGLIFIASIGLILNAHTLTPEVASLSGFSLCFYSCALYYRRPFRSSVILGLGLSILFLAGGFLPFLAMFFCLVTLYLFSNWRNKRYLTFIGLSSMIAISFIFPWLIIFKKLFPEIFLLWVQQPIFNNSSSFLYIMEGIAWFTWPALPLAVSVIYTNYKKCFVDKNLTLPIIFILSYFILISFQHEQSPIYLLPFLVPFSILGAGAIDNLKRGAASALNWFGILIFGFIGIVIWLGWLSSLTSMPHDLYLRIYEASANFKIEFSILNFLIALAISSLWIFYIIKSKITNRSMISNWAIGITMIWVIFIMLWGDSFNNRKSMKSLFTDLKPHLVQSSSCLYSQYLNDSQINILHYYTKVKPINYSNNLQNCKLALIRLQGDNETPAEFKDWREIWTGKRPKDKFYFVLLRE